MPVERDGPHARLYEFAPGLRLRVTGGRAAAAYFDSEYGPAATDDLGNAAVEIGVGTGLDDEGVRIHGTHKTVAWSVSLGDSRGTPLRAGIVLRGRPLSFALSLVQGYFVEPLLAVAGARAGLVLVPGAGLLVRDGALLVLGRSRTGKSSLSARALARGMRVLGDDQVLVEPGGRCLPFPRRLRAYGDLARTAPAAYGRLPPSTRAAVVARRAVQTLSRGYVAPPVHVPPSALGQGEPAAAAPVVRIALVERAPAIDDLRAVEADLDEVVAFALELLEEQRAHLRAPDATWAETMDATGRRQQQILRRALLGVPALRVSLPQAWPAERAVPALARLLGTEH